MASQFCEVNQENQVATALSKRVTRRSDSFIRDGSRSRPLVVTLYPGGTLGLRPAKTRREEVISLDAIYSVAVKMRVASERAAKIAARKARRAS